jgi:hypothetical protein
MNSFLIALLITGCLFGARAALNTFASQMGDPSTRWLVAACVVVIALGLWR